MTTPTIDVNKLVEAAKRVQFLHAEVTLLKERQTNLDDESSKLHTSRMTREQQLTEARKELLALVI